MSQHSRHGHGRSEIWSKPTFLKAFAREQRRLGARLRTLRNTRGLSADQAAELIGIHPVHLQRLETAGSNVTLGTLVAAALAYRVPLVRLFQDE